MPFHNHNYTFNVHQISKNLKECFELHNKHKHRHTDKHIRIRHTHKYNKKQLLD
jgi:hypothetical protein